jgi:hypothetical protein
MAVAVLASCASAGPAERAVDAGPIDSAPRIDAPTPIDGQLNTCVSTPTCQGAMMLGTVSGDTGNVKLSAMGTDAAWFRVRVTEDENSIGGLALRVAAKLTSPSAVNFDVFVYVNTGSDVIECSHTVGTATTAGPVDQVKAEWGEGTIANGSNDGRNASIEVRPISSNCDPGQPWQLEIEGDWN